jgi:hypothetical protein
VSVVRFDGISDCSRQTTSSNHHVSVALERLGAITDGLDRADLRQIACAAARDLPQLRVTLEQERPQ